MTDHEPTIDGEYYHRDIFGTVVDVDMGAEEEVSDEVKSVSSQKGEFNYFAFTDAIGERKKKDAWVLYEKALASGAVPEQLFYKAIWIVKTMLLAEKCANAEEAKLNPFVYRKAKGFLKNFKAGEVEKLSQELVEGYHRARRGDVELEMMLEKILLSL